MRKLTSGVLGMIGGLVALGFLVGTIIVAVSLPLWPLFNWLAGTVDASFGFMQTVGVVLSFALLRIPGALLGLAVKFKTKERGKLGFE